MLPLRLTALLTLLAATTATAQQGEIFIPGADNSFGTAQPEAPQARSALSRCLANATAENCAGATMDPSGIQTESFSSDIQTETLVLDLSGGKVTSTPEPPAHQPDYNAPTPPSHGKVALPSVAITIEFDFDSDRIRADQFTKIASLANAFSDPALAGTTYAVIGHTDTSGSEGYNCDLSLRRSASVARALDQAYVPLQLYPVGFGEHVLKNVYDPRAPENRRVTFLRLPDHPATVLQTAAAVCGY